MGRARQGEASEGEKAQSAAAEDTRVLRMLYKGNIEEVPKQQELPRKGKLVNPKHGFYRNTRCGCVVQEAQNALPAGVANVYEDSDDDEAYTGEQQEIAKELDGLRAARQWTNPEDGDAAAEGEAF